MPRRHLFPAVFTAVTLAAASAHADVTFVNTYTDSAGTGFFDPTFGAQRQAAWQFAENIWASKLLDLYTPGNEVINVRASFQNLGGSSTSAVVGNAQPFISEYNFAAISPKFQPNTVYPGALANHLAGTDLSPGTAEITATFNSSIDSGSLIGGRTFYYGTDGNPNLTPPSQIDFVTVALHELGHGLGFTSAFTSSGSYGNGFLPDGITPLPNAYDRFLYRASTGQYLVNEPANSTGNNQRAADLVSGDLYFLSPSTLVIDGPNGEKLYAPNPYEPGSSTVHIDKTLSDLMNPNYTTVKHDPSLNDLMILSDIGWDINPAAIPEPASLTILSAGAALLLKRRKRSASRSRG
jgi:hypothetical protein